MLDTTNFLVMLGAFLFVGGGYLLVETAARERVTEWLRRTADRTLRRGGTMSTHSGGAGLRFFGWVFALIVTAAGGFLLIGGTAGLLG